MTGSAEREALVGYYVKSTSKKNERYGVGRDGHPFLKPLHNKKRKR